MVPLRMSKIAEWGSTTFADDLPPKRWPKLVIGVEKGQQPHLCKGSLKRISPEETHFAVILRLGKAIAAGKFDDEAECNTFRASRV